MVVMAGTHTRVKTLTQTESQIIEALWVDGRRLKCAAEKKTNRKYRKNDGEVKSCH